MALWEPRYSSVGTMGMVLRELWVNTIINLTLDYCKRESKNLVLDSVDISCLI